MKKGALILIAAFAIGLIMIAPVAASVDSYSISPETGGASEISITSFNLLWNGSLARSPVSYIMPSAGGRMLQGNALYDWHRWPDHQAIIDYKNNGTTFLTAEIDANIIGYNSLFNRSPGVEDLIGFDVDLQWTFTYVNPDLLNMTGTLILTPTSVKDNITLSFPSYGMFFPTGTAGPNNIPDHLGLGESGSGGYNNPIMGASGMRVLTFTGGSAPPMPTDLGPVTVRTWDGLTAALLGGTHIDFVNVTTGIGNDLAVPAPGGIVTKKLFVGDQYSIKGWKDGYDNDTVLLTLASSAPYDVNLILWPQTLVPGNCTVWMYVKDNSTGTDQFIEGATVSMRETGEVKTTGPIGSTVFTEPDNAGLNYTVSPPDSLASAYYPFTGGTGCEGLSTITVRVALPPKGTGPVAAPTPACAFGDLSCSMENGLGTIGQFFPLLIFGGLFLIGIGVLQQMKGLWK